MKNIFATISICVLALGGLAACNHGAEKTGEAVDNAAYSVKSSVQKATGSQGPAQSAGEKIDDAAANLNN